MIERAKILFAGALFCLAMSLMVYLTECSMVGARPYIANSITLVCIALAVAWEVE